MNPDFWSTFGVIVLCVMVSGVVGCLMGMLLSARLAGRIVREHLPDMPEFIAAEQIYLTANVAVASEGGTETRLVMSTTASELASIRVERWLDDRGLMMAPKGKDFTVPVKGSGHARR